MPVDYKNYVGWFKQFSEYIRFERANNKCEQCGAPNGEIIERGFISHVQRVPIWFDGEGGTYHAETGEYLGCFRSYDLDLTRITKIVLTTAHLDFEGGICQCKKIYGIKCAIPSHCKALCQRCHLSTDMPSHIKNRAETLSKRKDESRGLLNL